MKKTTLSFRPVKTLWPVLWLLMCWNTAMAVNGPGDQETRVKQKVDYVKDNGLLVSQLDPSQLSTLPIGIVREIDGKSFIIAVDSARITPQGGFFSAYAAVKLPNTADDDFLAFAAKNVSFKPNGGIGVSSATRLLLVSERTIQINEKVKLRLLADGNNYIEWDCNGFQSISLKGEFIFDKTMIEPDLDMDPGATNVKATFQVVGQRGLNFLINTSITPFKIAGLGDMAFSVTDATVDLSDLSNPTDFYYPTDYPSYYGGDANLWRGFYLKELNVKLPKGISTSQGRAMFTARHVVIDDMGFSGFLGIRNLFDINSGSIDGWAFSVDTIGMQILQNRLVGGALGGSMNLPFLKDDTLSYAAAIEQRNGELNFSFVIQTNANHVYNMAWGGTLKLDAGSQVMVKKYNGKFTAGAVLHGSLTIAQPIINVDQLKFQNLELSTSSPYLIRGTFALTNSNPGATQPRMAKFPISVSNIGFGIESGRAFLKTDIALNLMNSEDKGFSAKTSVKVKAQMTETVQTTPDGTEYKKHKWVYDGLEFTAVSIAAKIGSLELDGTLNIFNNDPLYGDGFRGNIALKFPPLKNPARANVYFGSKNENGQDYRYWQANLYVPVRIPVVTPIDLTGILGGLSYHMQRDHQNSHATFAALTSSNIPPTTDSAGLANRTAADEFKFTPNPNVGLGIMLGVTLVVKREEVINADATLGVEFNTHGGINQIWFKGGAYFFSGMNRDRKHFESSGDVASQSSAPVKCFIDMLYDNPNKVFHASIKTYVNIGGVMKGMHDAAGLVGEAVVHVDPRDWYMYIGRPSQMMGMDLIGIVNVRSYFMMGTKIERMPPPPPQITDILGGNWTPPDFGGPMASGNGFGFGVHFAARFPKNGDFTMGPFYAGFQIGAGADIMITRYNGQVNCGGSIFKPGIDGWYAAGQVYAYLQGSIGIKIRKKKFSIIDVGAAAILQARLPKPTFMKGAVGGRFRILGGLIKGSVRFTFTIGQDCAPVNGGSELDNIKVIESMKPDNQATLVSVFAKPTAVFNTPINTEMPLVEDDGNVHIYRVTPVSVTLTKVSDGSSAPGNVQYNSTYDAVVFNTSINLAGTTAYRFRVELKWQEKINGNWQNPGGSGTEDKEIREITFTTNNAPTSVPAENIAYSYPISRQYNFYKNQHSYGFLQLKTGQPDVFATNDQFGQWSVKARFKSQYGQILESDVSYAGNLATFSFPAGLENNRIYELSLVKVPVGTVTGTGIQDSLYIKEENVYVSEATNTLQEMNQGFAMDNQAEMDALNAANTTAYDPNPEGNTMMSSRIANTLSVNNELIIYRINFRSSMFNTLNDKIDALTNAQDAVNVISGNVTAIGKRFSTVESFDEVELFGRGNNDEPLIRLGATNNTWINWYMHPMMYEYYGQFNYNVNITWRDPVMMGDYNENGEYAPMKAVKLHNNLNPNGYMLTDQEVNAGYAPAKDDDVMFAYYLSWYCAKDFQELRNKAAVIYLAEGVTDIPIGAERLLSWGYADLVPGTYGIKVNYHMPGNPWPITTKPLTLQFGQ